MAEEKNLPATAPQSDDFMSRLLAASQSGNLNPENLKALLDANERVIKHNAEVAFNNDMQRLRQVLPTIVKNKVNTQTSSKYADLEAIKDAVDPYLSEYGFYDRYEDDYPDANTVGTTCEIVHRDGHSRRNRVQIPLDDVGIKGNANKTKPHATASSMTYAQRLAFCRALGIRIGKDDDGNAAGSRPLTSEQLKQIQRLLDEVKPDMAKFLEFVGADKVEEINGKKYDTVITTLKAKRAEILKAEAAKAEKAKQEKEKPHDKA